MLSRAYMSLVALLCIVSITACDAEPSSLLSEGNTEIDIVISAPGSSPGQLEFEVDFVSYRIGCPGSGLVPYDDSIEMFGSFEIDETRATPVWQLVTDLPPAFCTVALWVFFEDEVICSGSESKQIVEDGDPSTINKFAINLECLLSANNAGGTVEVDPDFTEVHGNYCPQLVWLGATPPVVTPGGPIVANVQTSSFDLDSTCGDNCDPTICDFGTVPPSCSPGPDLGLTSTLSAPAGNGSFGDPNAFDTTFTCDPLVPGPTEICVLVTDGDIECDQTRCITVDCPDLCAGVNCDDGNQCTRDACDPLTGLCTNTDAPDGIACDNCASSCQAGACDAGSPFAADFAFSGTIAMNGALQTLDATFVNPYSGASVTVNATNGLFNVNQSSYLGTSTFDTVGGTGLQDVFLARLPSGAQTVCGVERLFSLNSFDVMSLADEFIVLADMEIQGGNANDVIWANAGDDLLRGNNGLDLLDGGPGDDTIFGETGNDTITLWPGSGFDTISGGNGTDQVAIDAAQSQILISPAANTSYEFDLSYLGTPMAQIREVELLVLEDGFVDLLACTGGASDVCNLCGNDALNGEEECDDGNTVNGDGCADDCTAEY